jgi:hypothetical protein
MAEVNEFGSKAIDELGLPPELSSALKGIQADLAEDYRASFLAMVEAINRQASALDRIQTTLTILVRHLAPELVKSLPVPVVVQQAKEGETPDIATALVVADPIGAGYTLSQKALSEVLGLPQAYVSILVRAFNLPADGRSAVTVRKGASREMVNYHPRAAQKFLAQVATPPKTLNSKQQYALKRVQEMLLKRAKAAAPSAT